MPLDQHPLKESVRTNILETGPFEEYEACIGAGLDAWKWEQGEYPVFFKANILEWHRFHGLKQSHIQDAVASAPQRKK